MMRRGAARRGGDDGWATVVGAPGWRPRSPGRSPRRSSGLALHPLRIRRRVRAENPADLGAPLSYAVEVLAADEDEDLEPAAAALSRSGVSSLGPPRAES
jgi:hypothetical protein